MTETRQQTASNGSESGAGPLKILVTDGRSLAALAAVRSLGARGETVHCGDSFRQNLSSYSKYVDKRLVYPDPATEPERFVRYVRGACEHEEYDLVLPVRDDTTRLLSQYRAEFQTVTNVFVADHDVIQPLLDKGETVRLAREAGVPTPKTWFPEDKPREQIREELTYPALIRPRRSSGSRGITYVADDDAFETAFDAVESEYGTPIVQEYIDKRGYTTACLLFDRAGNVVSEFSYERVKEYPHSGGPTVVGVSTDDEQARRYAKDLLETANWMGPAEVEFILDQDGQPKLLEVNPRFWMPIHLAITAGVDFPGLIADLVSGADPEPVTEYELGVTYRWVLPNELLWTLSHDRPLTALRDFLHFDPQSECYGSLSVRDPGPVFGTIVQSLRYLTDPERRATIFDRGWSP